jgi:hypothetical protein
MHAGSYDPSKISPTSQGDLTISFLKKKKIKKKKNNKSEAFLSMGKGLLPYFQSFCNKVMERDPLRERNRGGYLGRGFC